MTPDIVVDVGNSRIKWGWGDLLRMASLPPDDEPAWDRQLAELGMGGPLSWAAAGVHPARLDRFAAWATARGDRVRIITHADIPLTINVDEPAKVGIDRLLGAVAARSRTPAGTAAITVDVGTALTVNLVDDGGAFAGGAILPGPRLMSLALHQYTAKLPLIEITGQRTEPLPAKNTAAAIRCGIDAAVVGGTHGIISALIDRCPAPPWLFFTGGGAGLFNGYGIADVLGQEMRPGLNLEGIRIAAEGLP